VAGERADSRRSPRRRAVLDALRASQEPLGVTEVAERVGIHPNTVRFHLDALVAQGTVVRALEEPAGPGRPRRVHTAHPGMDRGGPRSYHLLARILLSRLVSPESRAEAQAEAMETGRTWGRYLIGQAPPFRRLTADEAVGRLTTMLADEGFAPEPPAGSGAPARVRLRHCPFLELAEEFGPVVCSVHLGLMQGALAELRAPVAATRLEPFVEPDVCLAHFAPTGT